MSQINRAKFYLKNGFSVLMPDLRGTGKSGGDIISFGWHERKDLVAWVRELKSRGATEISADGQSLGAATIVYSLLENIDFEFVILESCYDNITNAFRNRVKSYPLPHLAFKPIEFFTEWIIGASKDQLTPDEIIPRLQCPALILAGDAEAQIPLAETMKLYHNCGSPAKRLHIFPRGRHEDFYLRFQDEFERQILLFLQDLPATDPPNG